MAIWLSTKVTSSCCDWNTTEFNLYYCFNVVNKNYFFLKFNFDESEEVDEVSEGSDDPLGRCDDSNLSGSEQSEGKLYFLTSLGQHEESSHIKPEKKVQVRRHHRGHRGGDLFRALSVAWDKERSNGRSTIRKTLLPVSCPVCFKVLSNAYNLKVHMSIHDGLNHQCSICGHTSKSRDALRKHLAYRHLIGQSGPVRPRQPATKRRRRGQPPLNAGDDVVEDLQDLQGDSGGDDTVESADHMIFD